MNTNNTGLKWKTRQTKHEQARTLNPEGYSHPNDQNIQIYPERRDREQWAEQIEMQWFDPAPETKAQKRRKQLALRELGR